MMSNMPSPFDIESMAGTIKMVKDMESNRRNEDDLEIGVEDVKRYLSGVWALPPCAPFDTTSG